MTAKGVVIVPSTAPPHARWLDSTGAASLLPVGNRPIICHVLDALEDAGVQEIAVLTPQILREEISDRVRADRRRHARVRCLDCDRSDDAPAPLSTLAAFARGAPTILHSSDGVLVEPLRPLADLLAGERADALLLTTEAGHAVPALGSAAQRALGLAPLRPDRATLGLAGVCFVAAGVLDSLLGGGETASAPCGLPAIAELLSATRPNGMRARLARGWHGFGGEASELLDINRVVLDRLESPRPARSVDGNRLEGAVEIDPSASVCASVISGPAVIGANATIKDSYVGPHTSIGEGVQLEGAEIEKSIVFAGASIRNVADRLVASVIGQDTKVFRDFSVPRAMRLCIGDGDEIALC